MTSHPLRWLGWCSTRPGWSSKEVSNPELPASTTRGWLKTTLNLFLVVNDSAYILKKCMLYTTLCLLLRKAEFAEESQSFLLTTKGMKTKKKINYECHSTWSTLYFRAISLILLFWWIFHLDLILHVVLLPFIFSQRVQWTATVDVMAPSSTSLAQAQKHSSDRAVSHTGDVPGHGRDRVGSFLENKMEWVGWIESSLGSVKRISLMSGIPRHNGRISPDDSMVIH